MRAAVFGGGEYVEIGRMAAPEPGAGQVRVRLEGTGVCGSNLPVWEGRPWFDYPLAPGAPGHEGWGRVETIGPGVEGLSGGERVALLSHHAYAEYDVAAAGAVVPLPAALDDRPFPGEPLACAVNVFRRSEIAAGQTVIVVGIGFLGALLVRLAAGAGARVLAISRRPFARELALGLGAERALPLTGDDRLVQDATAWANGGADRSIEAIGSQASLDLAGAVTRERGRLIVAGYHQDGPRQVNMQLWNWRGLDVINAHERDPLVCLEGLREGVRLVASGTIDLELLCTHRLPLERLPQAFELMRERPDGFLKAVVTP
jgi:threonine dehydrogenase-like Zn-dependent dehydrogenase